MERKESKGFVELEWVCPNCDGRNKGSKKTCENCGAPQPDNVKFQRAADEKIVTDEKSVEAAKAGADIHCGFCGTRNPATAVTCSQCGGDLKEGKARQAGQILQAAPPAPKAVTCTNCGTENPSSERVCKKCGSPLPRAAAPVASHLPANSSHASRCAEEKNEPVDIRRHRRIILDLLCSGCDALCHPVKICQRDSDRFAMANFRACAGSSSCELFQ